MYKRILWQDMKSCARESREALRQAFLERAVCVVNSLSGRMAGNKMILAMMNSSGFGQWLGDLGHELSPQDEEFVREHIPYTRVWGPTPAELGWTQSLDKSEILREPTAYVLKSFHGYGGDDIVIGCQEDRPIAAFESNWGQGFIVQEFVPHSRALVPIYADGRVEWQHHNVQFGAYVIDGKCVAIEAKTSTTLPINMKKGALRTTVCPVQGA